MGSITSEVEKEISLKPKRFLVSKFVQPKRMFQNAEFGDMCEFHGLINPNPPPSLNESTDFRGINPDDKHRIPVNILTRKSMREPCSICQIPLLVDPDQDVSVTTTKYDKYDKVEYLVMTPCKHIFHEECFKASYKTKPQCPLCRTDLRDMRNEEFRFEESEDDCSIYLVIQIGNVQYQISFQSPDQLLQFIQVNNEQQPESISNSEPSLLAADAPLQESLNQTRPIATQAQNDQEYSSVSISSNNSSNNNSANLNGDVIDVEVSQQNSNQNRLHSPNQSQNDGVMNPMPRCFIRTSDGDFPVTLQPEALVQLLNFRRGQDPVLIDADGNPLDLQVGPDGLHELQIELDPMILQGPPQNAQDSEDEYSLHMNSEQPMVQDNSSLFLRRNYSLG